MEEVYGFIKRQGQSIVNGHGEKILLRGVGLGGWLLPEGYMWRLPKAGDRPRRMEAFIEAVTDREYASSFWQTYEDRFIGEGDIIRIKEEGFNSIRLPFNSRTLFNLEENLSHDSIVDNRKDTKSTIIVNRRILGLMDRMMDWCEKHRLYVVLDMHGAPGGQTGQNIDDSRRDQPELFMSPLHRNQMIDCWRFLAQHYKDRWIIAGYDLMNEPLPEWFSQYNGQVMPLYKDITKVIREADKQHMIILEGVHWSTDWSVFYPTDSDEGLYESGNLFDDNIMLQFHKYWNNPDVESIKPYTDARELFNVPIFMGEGGENNVHWYAGAFQLFDQLDISWNFWTYKKMDNTNSLCSVLKPTDWDLICSHLENASQLSPDHAKSILNKYLENILFSNCDYNKCVVDSLLRRPPVKIPAIFYDFMGEEISYHVENNRVDKIDFRIEEKVRLEHVSGELRAADFGHSGGEEWKNDQRMSVHLSEGEWVNYSIRVDRQDKYKLIPHLLSAEETELEIQIGDKIRHKSSPTDWRTVSVASHLELSPGIVTIRVKVVEGDLKLEWLQFIG